MPFPALLGMMGGMGGAGAGAAGAAGGSGLFGGLLSSILGGAMQGGSGGGGQGSPIQIPYQQGMQPGGGANPSSSFWSGLSSAMMDGNEGGDSLTGSLTKAGLNTLASVPGAISDSRTGPITNVQHQVPGGVQMQNPGLFGLNQLIAGSAQGGWGRGR